MSMGTRRFAMLKKTHFEIFCGFLHGFLCRNMFPVIGSFWVFLSRFIVFVLGSIIRYFLRFLTNRYLKENDHRAFLCSNFEEFRNKQSGDYVDEGNRERENSSRLTSTSKYEVMYRKGISGFIEEPKTESFTVHEFYMGSNDYACCNGGILVSRDSAVADVGKNEFEMEDAIEEKPEHSVENFTVDKGLDNYVDESIVKPVEEKEDSVGSFMVEEMLELEEITGNFEDEREDSVLSFSFVTGFEKQIKEEELVETKFTVEKKTKDSVRSSIVEATSGKPEQEIRTGAVAMQEKTEDSVENSIVEKLLEKPEQEIRTEDILEGKEEKSIENVTYIEGNDQVEEKFGDFFDSLVIDTCLEKGKQEKEESKEDGKKFSPINKLDVKSISYEVLANNKFDLRSKLHQVIVGQKVENMENVIQESNTRISERETAVLSGLTNDSDDEFIEFEQLFEKQFVMGETRFAEDETESIASPEKCRELEDSFSSFGEEEDDSEFGSEHDDLMERLKMEMKIARTGGLPTILEESESPKVVEQLGPLQIDEKYDHKDHMSEIQKVYKNYSDKMKKLDILNSQTMHAISLLQLKDQDRLNSSRKSSTPAIKSFLSNKVLPFKHRKSEAGPTKKLIRDLQKEFETVYAGQICLSWEILHWQFGKLKKLSECDSHGNHQYNQVAGEFQHFQVVLQRFLENEPFQTRPRVENYVKNRSALRHLLQVPVIKDDSSKYKEDAVSSEMLTDIIQQSMHDFWEFLRADKDESSAFSMTPQQAQVAPHDPIDLELLMDVRNDLQKKEKRLKEIQRSTNCMIKKFQKQRHRGGNPLDQALFIAQVELKLVSRVLNMVKITTDQLVWCHEKLQKINISSSRRKIEIEPSFTLFPC